MDSKASFTTASRFVAAREQIYCELQDEAVILNFPDGIYYGLNAVGAWIWTLIQKPCSYDTILQELIGKFEVEPRQCECDLLSFLQDGLDKKLIRVQDEEA